MADQVLTPVVLVPNTISASVATADPGVTGRVAATSSNDVTIDATSDKMVITFLDTGGGGEINILAGYGSPLAPQGELAFTAGSGLTYAIYVESGRFKSLGAYYLSHASPNVVTSSASERGKIRIQVAANTTVAAYALP
jgi:hypothetical protein